MITAARQSSGEACRRGVAAWIVKHGGMAAGEDCVCCMWMIARAIARRQCQALYVPDGRARRTRMWGSPGGGSPGGGSPGEQGGAGAELRADRLSNSTSLLGKHGLEAESVLYGYALSGWDG